MTERVWPYALLALAVVAGFVPAAAGEREVFLPPPPQAQLELAALGHNEAMGAVLWLVTSQRLGRGAFEDAQYPHLEHWLDAVFTNNPYLSDAYALGTVILLTDRERSAAMSKLLARAEALEPDNFQPPFLRGIAAYFGELDPLRAADHFERAAKLPYAPEYLTQFAKRLRSEHATCATLVANLRTVAAADAAKQKLFESQAAGLLEKCLEREIEQAAAGYTLQFKKTATIEDLLATGYLKEAPPHPPGRCWKIYNTSASLKPCPPTSP